MRGEKKRSKIKEEKELFTAPTTPEAYTRSPEDYYNKSLKTVSLLLSFNTYSLSFVVAEVL